MTPDVHVAEEHIHGSDWSIFTKRWKPLGSEHRAPVLLLHDSIGCVEMWREFPQALAGRLGRSVIAYDRVGFGKSSRKYQKLSADFIAEEAAVFAPAVLEGLGVTEFIAFGHSVGGAMAAMLAMNLNRRCRGVITESAQAFVEAQTLRSIAEAKTRFKIPAELAKLARYHGDKAQWVLDAWTDTWLSPEFEHWSLIPRLSEVICPLLAIHGEKDEFGSAAFPHAFASMISGPGQQYIVPGGGHVPHRENATQVLTEICRFVDERVR
jgi:pimeloyl-ACP methyl ester carboxylesterase